MYHTCRICRRVRVESLTSNPRRGDGPRRGDYEARKEAADLAQVLVGAELEQALGAHLLLLHVDRTGQVLLDAVLLGDL